MPYLGGAVAANVNDDDALDARLHANVAMRHGGASPLRVVKCVGEAKRAKRAKRRKSSERKREATRRREGRARGD
jgi:hypothetical protein